MFAATSSASSRWYCQSALPVSVTNPLVDRRVDSRGDEAVQPQGLQHVAAQVDVVALVAGRGMRPAACSSPTVTPWTRRAAFAASRFWRKLPTVPRSVTLPSRADTAIAALSTFGSQSSSSLTRANSFSFDDVTGQSWSPPSPPPSGHAPSGCGGGRTTAARGSWECREVVLGKPKDLLVVQAIEVDCASPITLAATSLRGCRRARATGGRRWPCLCRARGSGSRRRATGHRSTAASTQGCLLRRCAACRRGVHRPTGRTLHRWRRPSCRGRRWPRRRVLPRRNSMSCAMVIRARADVVREGDHGDQSRISATPTDDTRW